MLFLKNSFSAYTNQILKIVDISEVNGSNETQEMAKTDSSLSKQKLLERKNAFAKNIHSKHFSTMKSANQAPSARYGNTKTYVQYRSTTSLENGHKTTSKTTYHNMLLPTATVTPKPAKYTTIRRVYDTGWNPTTGKKGTRSRLQNKTTIFYPKRLAPSHRYKRNESLGNNILEFNVVEKMAAKFIRPAVFDTKCNSSGNSSGNGNFWNNGQPSEGAFACKPYFQVFDVCRTSQPYYPTANVKCKGLCQETSKDRICNIRHDYRRGEVQVIRINCTMDVCNHRPVTVASIDHEHGIVKKRKQYYDIRSLERGVQKAVSKSVRHGYRFVFLSCTQSVNKPNAVKVEQMLVLPPLLKNIHSENKITKNENSKESDESAILPPNINVIVLDSISRAHFQRVLPDTTKALKEINSNSSSEASVFDFKLFQSLAPFTFVNVKSFLTGKQGYTSIKDRDIGFGELLEKLNKAGYEATAQEDTCWHDKWGSILTSNRKRDTTIRNLHERKTEWRKFNQITNGYKLSNLGLSHASCYILKKYGKTNMFNEGPSFCYDGKPLSAHLLEYATALHSLQESTAGTKPQFSYTHINIGHETTGKRVCVVDRHLRDMVTSLAKLNNTATILWSDHGAKTTQYAIDTMAGKFETYDAFMFLLFPNAVLNILGERLTTVILKNQRAIVSPVDLHATVLALSNWEVLQEGNQTQELGLFADKTWRRGCESLPVRDYSLCKCVQYYRFLDLKDRKAFFDILWMAEYVIGTLNDKLNKQLLQKNEVVFSRNCQWLRGVSFKDAIYDKKSHRYLFDVLVHSNRPEVFNVQVQQQHRRLSLFHWQRTSVYRDFDICKDNGVSLELCICNRKRKQKMHVESFDIQEAVRSTIFGAESVVTMVFKEDQCLALIERSHEDEVFAFSIANYCEVQYRLHIATNGSTNEWRVSNTLPMNINAIAYSITFAISARNIYQDARRFNIIITKIK